VTRILSFSSDDEFAERLESMIEESGYRNRSMFLRDASLHFAEAKQRGELNTMADETVVDGTLVIYYQHDAERRLMHLRHQPSLEVHSYHHNCLSESHTCVDTMQLRASASAIRNAISELSGTEGVDRVSFTAAPMRTVGCC